MTAADSADDIVDRLRAAGCVFAEEEAALLLDGGTDALADRVARRVAGEPLESVLGWAEFAGLRVHVAPGVFVPRRRSELLVIEAGNLLPSPTATVLDLCCGSGAIGAAIAARAPAAQVYAADLDPAAVACARRNLPPDRVFVGDLFAALPAELRGTFDLVVVNAPYVPSAEIEFMPREARLYEPRGALDGGVDGLDQHRAIAAAASGWLTPAGTLLIETSRRQASTTSDICAAAGFTSRLVRSDDLDATVVAASMPAR